MKLKNIPADITTKSIKEAQNEIKDIIDNLENTDTNLEESMEKYTRMVQLNNHIHSLHLYLYPSLVLFCLRKSSKDFSSPQAVQIFMLVLYVEIRFLNRLPSFL